MRDETDLSGLKLAIDLKRGTDPEKLMTKLFKQTPLEDAYACNFNILIAGMPRVMGVGEILEEWTAWRIECVRRRVFNDLTKKKDKLHLLQGLKKILLDIDKAIEIIRNTEEEAEVVPNLMIGFGIDEIQAEYVAEIKLRNINKEYILKRVDEVSTLEAEIADLEDILNDRRRVKKIIIGELENVIKKYDTPRRTSIVYHTEIQQYEPEEAVEDYPVTLFLSKGGYFKKITAQSLRMSSDQKYKEGDELLISLEAQNKDEVIFFTDRQQAYKSRLSDFDDSKASVLGSYIPSVLGMDEGENVVYMVAPGDYSGWMLFAFENGKVARVELSGYATKTNRKKLIGAYSDKSPLVSIMLIRDETDLALFSTDGRALIFNSALLAPKSSRSTQGVSVLTVRAKRQAASLRVLTDTEIKNAARYRCRSIPAAGAVIKEEDSDDQQMSLL
jgi:DNA gyrase subunit A